MNKTSFLSVTPPTHTTGTTYTQKGLKTNYTEGEVVVHFCGVAVGYGTVLQYCKPDGLWTSPSRNCSDAPPIGAGTAIGFSFAILNGLFVVTVLVRNYFCRSQNVYDEDSNSQVIDRPV